MSVLDPSAPENSQGSGKPESPSPDEQSVIKFAKQPTPDSTVLPTLFGAGYGTYQVRPENFALSFLGHTLLIVVGLLLLHLGVKAVKEPDKPKYDVTELAPYVPMHVGHKAGGGGGGGDASKLQASAGAPPKASLEPQLAPPTVDIPKVQAKITVQPSVVADLKFPQNAQVGDPLSKLMAPSNGTGVGSGIGNGSGGGVGSGDGRGVGAGRGGNFGGGVFQVGNGVTAPEVLFNPDPDYSDEARKAKYQGVVVLNVIVGPDGRVHNPAVVRALGMGLDEKALEKIMIWRFKPATKDNKPVAVQVQVEVSFNLY